MAAKSSAEPKSESVPIGASAIRHVPASALIPYARNARTHSEAQIRTCVLRLFL